MESALLFAIVTTVTSALTVAGVMLLMAALRGRPVAPAGQLGQNRLDAVFLFDDRVLIDANDRARALLAALPDGGAPPGTGRTQVGVTTGAWDQVSRYLASSFPDLNARLASLSRDGRLDLAASDGSGLVLTAEWLGDSARLTLSDSADDTGSMLIDRLSWRALDDELALLRRISDMAPVPTWRENGAGQVIWANGAYLRLLCEHGLTGSSLGWPLPALFPPGSDTGKQRLSLTQSTPPRELWFDLHRQTEPGASLCFAIPADDAHRAERTKREFVQTLTKTFATLPIGLAVFDRTRRLQLFNPALTDLTGLEPEFLLSRPGIEGFLNRMRDKRILPEPRDWHAWSRRLLEVETGRQGEFEETWALARGQTFRVAARPHPDGALAFLIEDITAETHMNRNFRAELTATRAALDMLDTAIAVFAANGDLVLTNTAFGRLWMLDGAETLAGVTLQDAITNWAEGSARAGTDPDLWARIRRVAETGGTTQGRMMLDDGEVLTLRAHRGTGGHVMIAFTAPIDAAAPDRQSDDTRDPDDPIARTGSLGGMGAVVRARAAAPLSEGALPPPLQQIAPATAPHPAAGAPLSDLRLPTEMASALRPKAARILRARAPG